MADKKTGVTFFMILAAAIISAVFYASDGHAISWRSDLESAIKSAQNSGEPIMADFYTDWCGWCKKLDSDTYSDDKVDTLSKDFICVKVNADSDRALAAKYNVRGYPTILFLNSNGDVIGTIVGYRGPAEFSNAMENILKNVQKTAPENKQPEPAAAEKPVPLKGKNEEKFNIEEFKRDTLKKIKKMQNANLQLDGILIDPKSPKAIINNKLVKIGDTIDEATVTSIEQDKVELSTPQGKKITLKMD